MRWTKYSIHIYLLINLFHLILTYRYNVGDIAECVGVANIHDNKTFAVGRWENNDYKVIRFNSEYSAATVVKTGSLPQPLNYLTNYANIDYFWLLELEYDPVGLKRVHVDAALNPSVTTVSKPTGAASFGWMTCSNVSAFCYVGGKSGGTGKLGELKLDTGYSQVWSIDRSFREVAHRKGSNIFYLSHFSLVTIDVSRTPGSGSYQLSSLNTGFSVRIAPVGSPNIIALEGSNLKQINPISGGTVKSTGFMAWNGEIISAIQLGETKLGLLFYYEDTKIRVYDLFTFTDLGISKTIISQMATLIAIPNTTRIIACGDQTSMIVFDISQMTDICHETCRMCGPFIDDETSCLNCFPGISKDVDGRCSINCPSGCKICKTTTTCHTCDDPAQIPDPGTGECCLAGQYRVSGNCFACDPSCLTCNGALQTNCLTCPSTHYLRTSDSSCQPCSEFCKSCTGPLRIDCLSCDTTQYYLDNEQCLRNCPSGQYLQYSENLCYNCHGTCLTCSGPYLDNCSSCNTPMFSLMSNRCKKVCASNQYLRNFDNTCQPCDSSCLTCTGVGMDKCTSCNTSIYTHQDGRCLRNCLSTEYLNLSNNLCDPCKSSCLTCSGPRIDQCESCDITQFTFTINRCIRNCGVGVWYQPSDNSCQPCDLTCQACDGPLASQCTACDPQYLNLVATTCVRICVDGEWYQENDNSCQPCFPTCLTCTGPNNDECTSCELGVRTLMVNRCQIECQDGFYLRVSDDSCQPCDPGCRTCIGPNNDDCTDCFSPNFNLESRRCLVVCPVGQIIDKINNICEPCHSTCKSCLTSLVDGCIECKDIYEMKNNICLSICKSYQILENTTNTCLDCHESCSTCSGTAINHCLSCQTGLSLLDNMCKCPCNQGFYRRVSDQSCQPCHTQCSMCTGPLSTNCQACKSTASLIREQNYCKIKCDENFYIENGSCKECDASCKSCFGPASNNCISCHSPLNPQNNECTCDVSQNSFEDQNGECQRCHEACKTCSSGPTASHCLTCEEQYLSIDQIGDKCVKYCPIGFYTSSRTTCTKCGEYCQRCEASSRGSIDPYICRRCEPSFLLHLNECVTFCPIGFTVSIDNLRCEPCNSTCKSCRTKEAEFCTECHEGSIQINGKCYESCPSKYFETTDSITSVKVCKNCQEGCASCSSSSSCDKCEGDFYLHGNVCLKECPAQYQPQSNNVCERILCGNSCLECSSRSICTKCREFVEGTSVPYIKNQFGSCLPCLKVNGLKLVEGVCLEICGDGILHKLESSGHNCDDDNQKSGDGCSSSCIVESRSTCIREFEMKNIDVPVPDLCREQMKIKFYRAVNYYKKLRYILKFESISNPKTSVLTFKDFEKYFELMYFTKDEENNEIELNFQSKRGSSSILLIDIDQEYLEENLSGMLSVKRKEKSKYYLKDNLGFVVNLVEETTIINYSKSAFDQNKRNKENLNFFKRILQNSIIQLIFKLLLLTPVFFDLFAKSIQSLIFLRLINVKIPDNLDMFYEIMTSGLYVHFGSTEYQEEDSEATDNSSFIDRILKIDTEDYAPPSQFKKLQLSTLSFKTSLPLIIYPLMLYILCLVLITLKKKLSIKVYDKNENSFTYFPKNNLSKISKLLYPVLTLFHDLFVWNTFIRSNLFIIQQYCIGIFLNIFYLDLKDKISLTSFGISFILLLILIINIGGYLGLTNYISKIDNITEYKELKVINYYRGDSLMARNLFIFKVMVCPLFMSIAVTLFSALPLVALILLNYLLNENYLM